MTNYIRINTLDKLRFFLIYSLLTVSLSLHSDFTFSQRYNFTVYNNTDGLPGNQINDIMQDSHGRLWIGTMNGISIFDGNKFTSFENTNPISSNPVKTIFEDSKGNIWIGMIRKGVCKFTGTTFEFYNTGNGLLGDNVNAITEDNRGNIWIGTSEGLNRFDGKLMHTYTTLRGLVDNNIFSLKFDKNGDLWIATLGGVSRFDGVDFVNYTTEQGLLSNVTYNLLEGDSGRIWISTYLGISVFDDGKFTNYSTSNGLITDRVEEVIKINNNRKKMFASYGGGVGIISGDSISYFTVADGLPSNIVKTLLQDREGNIWIGTWSGLCKYNGDKFLTYTHVDGLTNNNILSIAADSSGRVFFGTLTGGVNYTEGNQILSLGQESGLKGFTVWAIHITKDQEYWFGTTNGPAKLDINTKQFTHPITELDNVIVYTILKDNNGRLLFGTDKGIFIKDSSTDSLITIGPLQGLLDDKVRVIFQDKTNKIWIGTLKNIYYLDEDYTVESFTNQYNLPDASVTSIIEDSTGRILVSTYDYGVFIIGDGVSSNIIKPLNSSNGLFSNRILFNFLDSQNNLWLGTPDGLDVINWKSFLNTGKINLNHFDKSNGYQGVETNAACMDNSVNIWFASVNGAIRHQVTSTKINSIIPLIRITEVELFFNNTDWRKKHIAINQHTGLPENMILAHDNNHITINYSGIYLTAPGEVKYQYMLEGFNEDWAPVTTQTSANYSNLDPGTYTFKVKSTANGRVWSNPVTISFVIKPPYWLTPFFYFLYTLAGASSIFLFLRLRTRNLQRSQNLLRQKVEQRTRELNSKNLELEKLSIVASETDNAVLIFNENSEIEWANAGFTKLTGYTVKELSLIKGPHISSFTFSNEVNELLKNCIEKKESAVFESQILCKNGSMKWISNTLTPIFNNADELNKIVVIDTDITYRKQMEEQIRESLEEKGLLLREIHHRVKNNLQIIISLFNLQSQYVSDTKAYEALKEGQERIKSMALIHERFYQNDGLSRIDFDDYIRRLVESLYLSFNISPERIEYVIETEKISLDIDTAVPCGLIINELVSNTLKHAFEYDQKGMIRISFKKIGDNHIRLIIKDNGKGLPDGFVIEETDSLGMQLISALSNQLDATLKVVNEGGATFIIEFQVVS